MAELSSYPAVTTLAGTERIPVITTPGVAGGNKYITADNLALFTGTGANFESYNDVPDAVGDGVTDDTDYILGRIAALMPGTTPGVLHLPYTGNRVYGMTEPIVLQGGQSIKCAAPSGIETGPTFKALAGFTGDAMIMSGTVTAGDWWHKATIEGITVDCDHIADIGILIHQGGEESVLRRVDVWNALDACIRGTGNHAPFTLEYVGVRPNDTGAIGLDLTVSAVPARVADGNGGPVRIFALSGDNGWSFDVGDAASHIRIGGEHTVNIVGLKSEIFETVVDVASTSRVTITGDAIRQSPASGDVVKISGGQPVVTLRGMRADQYTNVINDVVAGLTLPSPAQGTQIADVVWAPNSAQSISHELGGHIIQANATGKSALRLRNFSAGSSANPLIIEDYDGTELVSIGAAGDMAAPSLTADVVVANASITLGGVAIGTVLQPIAQSVNAQTGTTYTLVAADKGKLVTLSNGSAITLTVPQDSDATIAIGTYIDLYQLGAGQVTTVAGTGATLRVSGLTAKARAQYSRFGVQKVSADTWSLFGDLAAS